LLSLAVVKENLTTEFYICPEALNWDNIDWDNFSCVDMTRVIRNEMNAKYPTIDVLFEHLVSRRTETEGLSDKVYK